MIKGKLGDLAGFTSATALAIITLLISYEAARLFTPVPIRFAEALPIATLGLIGNFANVWLLSGGHHHHGHAYGSGGGHAHYEEHRMATPDGILTLSVFKDSAPPYSACVRSLAT